jgi:imidazole glycerol-phosphate synthase subunit HisH
VPSRPSNGLRPVVIDYGAGNLRSVIRALAALGVEAEVTNQPGPVLAAQMVILPGVGAAGQIMRSLQRLRLDDAIRRVIAAQRPFLGVCMGMQVLMERSDEDGGQQCLGVFPGSVKRLETELKVPHMGWNAVHQEACHPVWNGIPDNAYFYFVHSYAVRPADGTIVLGTTDYDGLFPSAIGRDNVVGTQFHPEKSGGQGLRIYRNFLTWAAQW